MRRLAALALVALPGLLLAACTRPDKGEFDAEIREREAYAKKTLQQNDAGDTLFTMSSSEVQFGAGFGMLSSNPSDEFRSGPFRWMGAHAHVRLKSHGRKRMKIVIAGWLHEKILMTHPSMDVFIDNYLMGASAQFDDEHYWFEVIAPEWVFTRDWVDMTIRMTAVGFHWDAPPELRTIVLYRFEYKEAD